MECDGGGQAGFIPADGVLPIPHANALFLEPTLMLSSAYSRFSLRPSAYYSRSLFKSFYASEPNNSSNNNNNNTKKRKRKVYSLNCKEQRAQRRHQEIRQFILDAHTAFLALPNLSSLLRSLERCILNPGSEVRAETDSKDAEAVDFVKLAELWQAPLYELFISSITDDNAFHSRKINAGEREQRQVSLFNTIIENVDDEEMIAECAGHTFLLPKNCRLLISDIRRVHQLVPGSPSDGYNVILVDPPWENKSVHRKSLYPTLPNKHLFSLPLQKLTHKEGALLGLWVTNREKLRAFVEEELFPAWGIVLAGTWYWLKVRSTGEMISNLDLAHHKPYECLLLGYISCKRTDETVAGHSSEVTSKTLAPFTKGLPDKHVLISIPGDHSRKPPVGSLLSRYAPGPTPVRGLELFARELNTAWTSWGNEPLCFQRTKYFTSNT